MSKSVGIRAAKAALSECVEDARREGEVILTSRGKPVAKIVAIEADASVDADSAWEDLVESGVADVDRRAAGSAWRQPPVKPQRGTSMARLVRAMRR